MLKYVVAAVVGFTLSFGGIIYGIYHERTNVRRLAQVPQVISPLKVLRCDTPELRLWMDQQTNFIPEYKWSIEAQTISCAMNCADIDIDLLMQLGKAK